MTPVLLVVAAIATAAPASGAYELPEAAARALREQAHQMTDAALNEDDAAVVRHMYPRVVQAMGGAEQAQRRVEAARLGIKRDGASVVSATYGSVRACARVPAQVQCLLAGKQVIQIGGGRLLQDTETLAFSADGGKSWTFLSVAQEPASLRAALPELSPSLPLRRQPAPVFEREP